MFKVLIDRDSATRFPLPISKKARELCGFAFVDDCDLLATADGKNDPNVTLDKMQEVIDTWEGVAKSTGGALAPEKSWWYSMHYKWNDKGDWSYATYDNIGSRDLFARDANNIVKTLKYLPVHQGKRCWVFICNQIGGMKHT